MTCSRATGQHRPLRRLSADHGLDCVVQFRVGHRSAVVLQDEMGHFDARVLAHDPGELCPELHLDSDSAFSLREEGKDLLAREWIVQPAVEVSDVTALPPDAEQLL